MVGDGRLALAQLVLAQDVVANDLLKDFASKLVLQNAQKRWACIGMQGLTNPESIRNDVAVPLPRHNSRYPDGQCDSQLQSQRTSMPCTYRSCRTERYRSNRKLWMSEKGASVRSMMRRRWSIVRTSVSRVRNAFGPCSSIYDREHMEWLCMLLHLSGLASPTKPQWCPMRWMIHACERPSGYR